jgi:predicted  nucleic acid-binding Zn-ribbon protein
LNRYLKRLIDIAEEKKLYYLLIEIYILQSKIASIKKEIEEAQELLKKAKNLAEKNKLEELSTKVFGEQELLRKQIDTWKGLMKKEAPVKERIIAFRLEESISSIKKQLTANLFEDCRNDPTSLKKLFVLKI